MNSITAASLKPTSKNINDVLEQLHNLAFDNDSHAQFQLADLYYHGRHGIKADIQRAVDWLKKAAKGKHAEACFHLGTFYETGKGVEKNLSLARRLYEKAAVQDHAAAWYFLANFYHHGIDVKQDLQSALTMYDRAEELGYEPASKEIHAIRPFHFEQAYKFIEAKQYLDAFAIFDYWAKKRDADAQYDLATMYFHGEGVDKDEKKALDYFKQAGHGGHGNACYIVGECFRIGTGTPPSDRLAFCWFKQAQENGYDVEASVIEELEKRLNLSESK